MDQDEIRQIIEGVPDMLTPAFTERVDNITCRSCPRCGSTMQPVTHPVQPFDPVGIRLVAKCLECGVCEDPDTGLTISTG